MEAADGGSTTNAGKARRATGFNNFDINEVVALYDANFDSTPPALPGPPPRVLTIPGPSAAAGVPFTHYSWNGNVGTCNAGSTTAAHRNEVVDRINFYRTLVGRCRVWPVGVGADSLCLCLCLSLCGAGGLAGRERVQHQVEQVPKGGADDDGKPSGHLWGP
jgi:hypothetical protein